jgi:hypothetical protein
MSGLITKLLAVALTPYVLAMRIGGVIWETVDDTRNVITEETP